LKSSPLTADQAKSAEESGADFVVFDAGSTDAAVLDIEDLASVITITDSIEDDQARGFQALSIDAALYSSGADSKNLTVVALAQIQAVRSSIRKPTLVRVSSSIGTSNVETLRNAGIAGLVVELSSASEADGLRKIIDSLPKKKRPSNESTSPLVPFGLGAGASSQGSPDEDEDDY
jgi:hypothetical protein